LNSVSEIVLEGPNKERDDVVRVENVFFGNGEKKKRIVQTVVRDKNRKK